MRESAIEAALVKQVEKIGGQCWKWNSTRRGVPDRIVFYRGQVVFVELKAPGAVPTAQQKHVHELLRMQGMDVLVIDTIDGVIKFVNSLSFGITGESTEINGRRRIK